ncbi:YciK family oxidoreductase [Gallaecimonas pentaromativorans]|uniref:NAD(P)-dependent dehydrogenase (Short-subunit alcohol dehydrogenase family) n=1 Tax=Gallaecimonas pentaromativorans TaxID=584787 RepID=A0A3N1PBL2_9GAMM|nr:YciK family oxidoreductase [Gallaecimonas pentaromativorans]ROQ24781.1 NAD(P)-dependent dehydrogenase (short-subunit alcohol dehydrogenase family) [Gallaecimonas pentaromativorans]
MLDYQASKDILKNRVVLVTGASAGIGREAALCYAAHGATVLLLGRNVKNLEAVYDDIAAIGAPQAAIIPLDMLGATDQHYRDMALTIENQFGRLDGVLMNAGELGTLTPFEQTDDDSWDKVMKINVDATFRMTRALLPLLKASEDGRLIFTSSGVGKKGRAYWGAYAVSKFATEGMMQVLADENSKGPLRVNCINPGGTRTAMRAKAFPAEDPMTLKTPADLMPLYLYLMGPDSKSVNGQSIDAQPK